jgi:RNA polymerase sigma factor (TIGR02999 family)
MRELPNLPAGDLFHRWRAGDREALDALLPLVYEELRRVARARLRNERGDHTLQTTALIHEAYLRLANGAPAQVNDHCHFISLSSGLMRQILVDHARAHLAAKRRGGCRVALAEDVAISEPGGEVDVLAVDDALTRLSHLDLQQARVVELRYFGGLSIRETSDVMGVSEATVKRDWATARAWLRREMLHVRSP